MRDIDEFAVELSYPEYVEEAQKLKEEGWKGFKILPPRAGVTYVKAYNPVLNAHRLITKKEYLSLKELGMWEKGVDRLKGSVVRTPKTNPVDAKRSKKLGVALEKLIAADKTCKDYESLSAAVKSIISGIVN